MGAGMRIHALKFPGEGWRDPRHASLLLATLFVENVRCLPYVYAPPLLYRLPLLRHSILPYTLTTQVAKTPQDTHMSVHR